MEPSNWIAIVALLTVFYQEIRTFSLRGSARAALKADLEILKLIDVKNKNYKTVNERIDRSIAEFYLSKIPFNWKELVRLLILIVLIYYVYVFYRGIVVTNIIPLMSFIAGIYIVINIMEIKNLISKWYKDNNLAEKKALSSLKK